MAQEFKLNELASWRTYQKTLLNTLVTQSVGVAGTPLANFSSANITSLQSQISTLLDGIVYTRVLTSSTIKNILSAIDNYITVKYINILDDPKEESLFTIPAAIPSGTYSASGDDFRDILIDISKISLPTLSLSDFVYTSGPTVAYSTNLIKMKTDLSTGWNQAEADVWTNLLQTIDVKEKVLYISSKKPKMKYYPKYAPAISKDTYLLYNMHFKDAIKTFSSSADFLTLYPEINQ